MTVTRELKITYGTYVVSGSVDDAVLAGKIQLNRGFESGSLEFTMLITATTEALFATAVAAAEVAFRKPYQNLLVEQGSETLLGASQTSNTALDPLPTITKGEAVSDTGRSRLYDVSIEYGLPANTGAESQVGLRDLRVDVSYDPARRRTVTISGTVTASGGNGARDQYDAIIAAIVAAVKSDLSITDWELTEEPTQAADTNDKLLEFTRIYEELIFSQAGSSLDDADIVRQRLSIARREEGPGDTPTAERLAAVDLSYEAWMDSTTVTSDTALRAKYDGIRSWLITQMDTTLNGGQFALVEERPEFFYDENRLSVSMVVLGQPNGEVVLENRVTTEDDDAVGREIVPAWSGDPIAAYIYNGPRVVIRTVTQIQKKTGTYNEQHALQMGASDVSKARARGPEGGSGGIWTVIRKRPRATPVQLGIGTDTMDITELALTTQMRYTREPGPASGGRDGLTPITNPRS